MSKYRKEIISEKTLIAWAAYSAFSSSAYLLISSAVVYLLFDCWVMYQHQLAGGVCAQEVNMTLVFGLPILMGILTGTILTYKVTGKEKLNGK